MTIKLPSSKYCSTRIPIKPSGVLLANTRKSNDWLCDFTSAALPLGFDFRAGKFTAANDDRWSTGAVGKFRRVFPTERVSAGIIVTGPFACDAERARRRLSPTFATAVAGCARSSPRADSSAARSRASGAPTDPDPRCRGRNPYTRSWAPVGVRAARARLGELAVPGADGEVRQRGWDTP